MYIIYIYINTCISLCGLQEFTFFSDSLGAGGRAYIYIRGVFYSFREIGIKIKNSSDERPLKIPNLTCV